jgi:hypothetical protein
MQDSVSKKLGLDSSKDRLTAVEGLVSLSDFFHIIFWISLIDCLFYLTGATGVLKAS